MHCAAMTKLRAHRSRGDGGGKDSRSKASGKGRKRLHRGCIEFESFRLTNIICCTEFTQGLH